MQRKHVLLAAVLIAGSFLIGYIPNELGSRRLAQQLRRTELDLRLANLHRQLGMASYEAQRNNFGVAGDLAKRFFEGCRQTVPEFRYDNRPRTQIALQGYAQSGDVILGELANGDPAVKERLASMFVTMNGVIERKQ
jgi:hypothetical protein